MGQAASKLSPGLLSLPWELREEIIFWAYYTGDRCPFAVPIIRLEGIPSVTPEDDAHETPIYTLRWIPRSHEKPCQLALVNRQLNEECEQVIFTKFALLINSGLNKPSIDNFIGSLSLNARHLMRRVALHFYIPMFPFSIRVGRDAQYDDEHRPDAMMSALWKNLPNLKNMDVFVKPALSPQGREITFNMLFATELCTFLAAFRLERSTDEKNSSWLNILFAEQNMGIRYPIRGNSVGQKVILEDMTTLRNSVLAPSL